MHTLQNQMFQIYPKIDRVGCRVLKIDEGGGPTLQMQEPAAPGVTASSGAAGTAASRRLLEDKPHPHLTFVSCGRLAAPQLPCISV